MYPVVLDLHSIAHACFDIEKKNLYKKLCYGKNMKKYCNELRTNCLINLKYYVTTKVVLAGLLIL